MGHQVVSRFFDRARQIYVDPGSPCPDLDPETVRRLVAARCLVEVADETTPASSPRGRRSAPAAPAQSAPPAPAE